MNITDTKQLIGKTLINGSTVKRIWLDEATGFYIALMVNEKGQHSHEKSTVEGTLINKLVRQIQTRDEEWILSRLSLLNVSELARQANVPRHKLADAERGKGRLSQEDCAAIRQVIDKSQRATTPYHRHRQKDRSTPRQAPRRGV